MAMVPIQCQQEALIWSTLKEETYGKHLNTDHSPLQQFASAPANEN